MLIFNILIVLVFVFAGIRDYLSQKDPSVTEIFLLVFSSTFFVATVIFYALTMINPGYV